VTLDLRIADASARLGDAIPRHSPAAFASSFGAEDMVILDLIHRLRLEVEVFTLDTGRLPEETHALIATARARYGLPIRVLHPDAADLEAYVGTHGNNAFYESIELRKRCCEIRKLRPLRRALVVGAARLARMRPAHGPAGPPGTRSKGSRMTHLSTPLLSRGKVQLQIGARFGFLERSLYIAIRSPYIATRHA